MNPSTEELLAAIDSADAKDVLVLPNNKNVVLAARQAKELSPHQVQVISTNSIAQGIGAMVAFKPDLGLMGNAKLMTAAVLNIDTVEITYAVRDASIDGRKIKAGDIMGLVNDELVVIEKDVVKVTLEALDRTVTPESELITILYGEDVSEQEAVSLQTKVEERFPDCDVQTYHGGQPLYHYILSVE